MCISTFFAVFVCEFIEIMRYIKYPMISGNPKPSIFADMSEIENV